MTSVGQLIVPSASPHGLAHPPWTPHCHKTRHGCTFRNIDAHYRDYEVDRASPSVVSLVPLAQRKASSLSQRHFGQIDAL